MHLALEDLGFDHVRTVLRDGHHVVIRETSDGSLKLYDPTSSTTKDGKLEGYVREFTGDEIKRKQTVPSKGFGFGLTSATEDEIGGITQPDNNGGYRQSFFAYEPEVKLDLAVTLGNLSEIKDDTASVEARIPFDMDAYREAVLAFMKDNNEPELTDADLTEITNSNRQPFKELIQAATTFYKQGGQMPDPYDFISSPLLKRKTALAQRPNPKNLLVLLSDMSKLVNSATSTQS